MDGLPAELVASVFRQLEIKDCITVSHVCKRWRVAAIENPLLWTRLALEFAPIDQVETLVARSQNAPLSLTVGARVKGEEDRVAKILAENMGHIDALSLQITLQCYTGSLRDALCTPAPLMVLFIMRADDDDDLDVDYDVRLPPLLFGGVAPCLSRLDLEGVKLPSTCPALVSVFSLRLRLPETRPRRPFCLSHILPKLVSLELTHQREVAHVSLKQGHRLIKLDMDATWDPEADLRAPLAAVNHADSLSIKATTTDADTLNLVLDSIRDVFCVSVGFTNPNYDERWDMSIPTACVSFKTMGCLRHFRIVEEPTVSALLDSPARMVTVAILNIAHHLLHLVPATLPNLIRLYIEFPSEDADMDYDRLALWLDAQRTPQLQTLILCGEWQPACEVGYQPLTRPRILSAARLAASLKTRPTPILTELRLRVELEETQEAAYALLAPTVLSFSPF